MTYADALARVSSIESRMSTMQVASIGGSGNFSSSLATAVNRFDNGMTHLDEPQDGSGPSVQLSSQSTDDPGAARIRAASLGTTTGVSPASAAGAYTGSAGSSGATRGLTPELSATFDRLAARYDVPVGLAKGVARAESGFRSDAVSGAGAQGLMQLMPSTAKGLGVTDPFDAEQNAEGGIKYLHNLLERFHGDTTLAVAAYNAGPNAVAKYGGVPPYAETQTYVKRVLDYARDFGYAPDSGANGSSPATIGQG